MNIELDKMEFLGEILKSLQAGTHISMKGAPQWYVHLNELQSEYQSLFRALGFNLQHQPTRQFFYFEDGDSFKMATSRSQDITLIMCCLIDHWANQGNNPYEIIEKGVLTRTEIHSIFTANKDIFTQRKIGAVEDLEARLSSMITLGFLSRTVDGKFSFLPPIYRFLDATLDILADVDSNGETQNAAN